MSVVREEVHDVQLVGHRSWVKCDGCGAKGPVLETQGPDFWRGPNRVPGWAAVVEVGENWADGRRIVDLCRRCFGFTVADALDRVKP